MIVVACLGIFKPAKSVHRPAPSIALKGTMLPPPDAQRCRKSLIEAAQNAAGIDLVFNANLGILDLDVINQTGDSAFQTTVRAVAGSSFPIDTSGWESGKYILVVMDEGKDYLEGKFNIS